MKNTLLMTAALALAAGSLAVSPAAAGEKESRTIVIDYDGDILDELVDLDADEIADLQEEFADARAEIEEAIDEIEDARAEMDDVPGGGLILKIAFGAAQIATEAVVAEVMAEVRADIDEAEDQLGVADLDAGEREETQDAIDALRDELDALEASLDELMDALES